MICRAGIAALLTAAATALPAADPAAPIPAVAPAKQAAAQPPAKKAPPPQAPTKTAAKSAPRCGSLIAPNHNPKPREMFRDCEDTPQLVRLPGGKFLMGESGNLGHTYERPLREVQVPPFSIGRYEVTFREWDVCHREGGCVKRPDDEGWGRDVRPVINVSWVDAKQYVAWLSNRTGRRYRLPSEAEWEYAARAGTTTSYSWGDSSGPACRHGNTFDLTATASYPNWFWYTNCADTFVNTAPAGTFQPNPWGIFDLHGNVWEWVEDCWHSDYTGAPTDGSAWITGPDCGKRVNRGGGWGNHPRSMRSANRDADSATGSGDAFGFRVVRDDLPQPESAPPSQVAAPRTPAPAAAATAAPAPKRAAGAP